MYMNFKEQINPSVDLKVSFGTDHGTINNKLRYRRRYQISDYNRKEHERRINHALSVIRAIYDASRGLPAVTTVIEAANCAHATAKEALAAFERELQAKQEWNDVLIYVNSAKNNKLSAVISKELQQLLDNATYALFDLSPNNVYLLTLVCPGNSEEAYLAIAHNSQLIANNVIANLKLLFPSDFQLYYLYAWEVQDRESPHLHILLNLPNGHNVTQDKLTDIWLSVIDDIGDFYNISTYSNYDKPNYSPNNPHVLANAANIRSFRLQQNSKYLWTYLAKKESKEPRKLAIAICVAVIIFKTKCNLNNRIKKKNAQEATIWVVTLKGVRAVSCQSREKPAVLNCTFAPDA